MRPHGSVYFTAQAGSGAGVRRPRVGRPAARASAADRRPMASNTDIVRGVFDAFSRRDLAALLDARRPRHRLRPPTGRLAGRTEPYRGHEGLRAYLADVARVWEELRSEPDEFIEIDDDRVVCTGRVYALGRRARDRRAGGLGVAGRATSWSSRATCTRAAAALRGGGAALAAAAPVTRRRAAR